MDPHRGDWYEQLVNQVSRDTATEQIAETPDTLPELVTPDYINQKVESLLVS
jgi:hypothetical protein